MLGLGRRGLGYRPTFSTLISVPISLNQFMKEIKKLHTVGFTVPLIIQGNTNILYSRFTRPKVYISMNKCLLRVKAQVRIKGSVYTVYEHEDKN